jgi:hypothetical protein
VCVLSDVCLHALYIELDILLTNYVNILLQFSVLPDKIDGNLNFKWGKINYKSISNILKVNRRDKLFDLLYILNTPKYNESTLVAKICYDKDEVYHKVK